MSNLDRSMAVIVVALMVVFLSGFMKRTDRVVVKAMDFYEQSHQRCEVCNYPEIEVHHKKPFHLYNELAADSNNFVSLCRIHHWWVGHGRDWQKYNANIEPTIDALKVAYSNHVVIRNEKER